MKNPFSAVASFKNIQAFLDDSRGSNHDRRDTRRSAAPPWPRWERKCASPSSAATMRRSPICCKRLDSSLGKALAENAVVDEVLPEIKRRRGT